MSDSMLVGWPGQQSRSSTFESLSFLHISESCFVIPSGSSVYSGIPSITQGVR